MPLSDMACSLSPEGQRVIEKAQESLQRHQGQEPSGQPILIKLDTAYFLSHPKEGNNQVKVLVNYTLTNNSFISANANAVLKIYARNGTLLKTSSFPSGFILENNGYQTTFNEYTIQVNRKYHSRYRPYQSEQDFSVV